MAWTHYQKFLAFLMVITGTFNTLSNKYADKHVVPGRNGEPRNFNHPYMQSWFMFLGESLCLLVFKIAYAHLNRKGDGSVDTNSLTKGSRSFSQIVLMIPACCDMIATSVMYVGLTLTYASSFQMLRGSVIVFTGFLSMGFLNKKLRAAEWSGIGLVIIGLALVGASDMMLNSGSVMDTNAILTGDLLIICAQVITAVQMVVEEKFVTGRDIPPLQAVGWEGIFGFIGMTFVIAIFNFIPAGIPFADNPRNTLEDTADAFAQIGNSGTLFMAIIGIMLSIASFNFAGISVTKEMSATSRMILDSLRTVVIWAFSLAVGWQKFHYLQLIGFAVLLVGISCYNNLVVPQLIRKCQSRLGRHRAPENDQVRVLNAAVDDEQESR